MSAPIVPSPCSDVCRIDPLTGWCEGCLRTLDEVTAWRGLDNPQKRAVWKELPARRAAFAAAHAKAPVAKVQS